jgi:hypothetical protein
MPEYTVELLLMVEADSATDAEVLGERAAKMAMVATSPRGCKARIVTVIVSDVRADDE